MMTNDPQKNQQERPSTYVVQDRKNQEEQRRLTIQDQMITTGMRGILPEQDDPAIFSSVLDVACGTGGWLIEAAKTYSTMTKLIGVDISTNMIEYACFCAEREQVDNRVTFRVMDTLRMLEFPKDSFNLVNMRFGVSWLRTWDWAKLLAEFQRVTMKRGIIRITESDVVQNNSPALTHFISALQQALYNAGHFYRPEKDGITSELVPLMVQHGLEHIQTRKNLLTYRAGTPEGQHFIEDMHHLFHTVRPYIQKWAPIPDDHDTLSQQAVKEMQQPDFVATLQLLTAWGTRAIILK